MKIENSNEIYTSLRIYNSSEIKNLNSTWHRGEGPNDDEAEAINGYLKRRCNGADCDSPHRLFPQDGIYQWVEVSEDKSKYRVGYIVGNEDKLWVEERDRNYIFRLEEAGCLDETEPNLSIEAPQLFNEIIARRNFWKENEEEEKITIYLREKLRISLDRLKLLIRPLLVNSSDLLSMINLEDQNKIKELIKYISQLEVSSLDYSNLIEHARISENHRIYLTSILQTLADIWTEKTEEKKLIEQKSFWFERVKKSISEWITQFDSLIKLQSFESKNDNSGSQRIAPTTSASTPMVKKDIKQKAPVKLDVDDCNNNVSTSTKSNIKQADSSPRSSRTSVSQTSEKPKCSSLAAEVLLNEVKPISIATYTINNNILESADFLIALQPENVVQIEQKNHNLSIQSESSGEGEYAEIIKQDYTEKEIELFQNLGVTTLVLKKLANPDLEIDIFQSIKIVMTCLQMGKVESRKAQGQDLVLILGNTGSGKSTAVNYLYGCEMEKKTVGYTTQIIVKENSEKKAIVEIGHTKSKTLMPTVIDSSENGIAFCDCPGFHDNRGQEINIANAVNIRHTTDKAKSVKIILFIDYKTIIETRGRGIDKLNKTVDDLFGCTNSLEKNADSILIGITQVPIYIDDEKITLEKVKGILAQNKALPSQIITRIKILDPLERRSDEGCSRSDWLKAINNLTVVWDHRIRIKTSLNPEDELMLNTVSKEISKQINQDLYAERYVAAAQKLAQMRDLTILRHAEIDELYQDHLEEIDRFIAEIEQKIKTGVDHDKWDEVRKTIVELQKLTVIFKILIPDLNNRLDKLIKYINDRRLKNKFNQVLSSIEALAKCYDQDRELQQRLAYALHRLFNYSTPIISSSEATNFLAGYLKAFIQLECGPLRKLIENVCDEFFVFIDFAHKLSNKEIIKIAEENLLVELRRIADSSYRLHLQNASVELQRMDIATRVELENLNRTIEWSVNGEEALKFLSCLETKSPSSDELIFLLSGLAKLPNIGLIVADLIKLVLDEQVIIDSLANTGVSHSTLISPQLPRHIGEYLMSLKILLIEESKRINEEKRRNEAHNLVDRINNNLLPNNNFVELNKAVTRLIKIAPDQLQMITLKTIVQQHINDFTGHLAARNYDTAKDKFSLILLLKKELQDVWHQVNINLDIKKLIAAIIKHVNDDIEFIKKEISEAFSESNLVKEHFAGTSMKRLGSFFKAVAHFQDISEVVGIANEISLFSSDIVAKTLMQYNSNLKANLFVGLMVQIQYLSSLVGSSNSTFSLQIREKVSHMIQQCKDMDLLAHVGQILIMQADNNKESSRYAAEIIDQHPEFKRAETQRFLTQTKDRTIDEIFGELCVPGKTPLRACYQIYYKEYERVMTDIVDRFEQPEDEEVLNSAIACSHRQANKLQKTEHYSKYPNEVATLVANIFGVWTYLDAHSGGFKRDRTSLKQPHVSQVLAVLLFFGVDQENQAIQNHFLEVKTGEGKSLILAVTAVAFALLGYKEVHVACHNPWLVMRDEKQFRTLFQQFKLENIIEYNEIREFLPKIFGYDFLYKRVRNLLHGHLPNQDVSDQNEKILLLVDEADVFFSSNFLTQCVIHGYAFEETHFGEFIFEVWNSRKNYMAMTFDEFRKSVKSTKWYIQLLHDFPNIMLLADIFLQKMYNALFIVANGKFKYVVHQQRIGVIDTQASVIRTHNGWVNKFAAFHEQELGKTIDIDFYKNLDIPYQALCYYEMPQKYHRILGVTGTLFSVSEFENKILEEYNIKRKTQIPSVFQKKQLANAKDIILCAGKIDEEDDKGYFRNIKNMVDTVIGQDRAVLVVFEDEERLDAYQHYIMRYPYSSKLIRTNTLLTITDDHARELIISEAATRFTVTLMIRQFGRGSDFVCRDSQMRQSGGVAVICTFFPEHEAEEIQIKGRTCRQTDPGDFTMILFLDDLRKFNINTLSEIEQAKSKYSYLVIKRVEFQKNKMENLDSEIQSIKILHQKTMRLSELLSDNSLFKPWSEKRNKKQAEVLEIFHEIARNTC